MAVLIGAVAAYLQFTQQQQTATQQIVTQQKATADQIAAQQKIASDRIIAQMKVSEISSKASQDLLIANQVSKGFEQLAGQEMAMRLGGIYALEAVMNGTAPGYHQPVLEALCAFVREGTSKKPPTNRARGKGALPSNQAGRTDKPATDIQATLTVIGRRSKGAGIVSLREAQISGANLSDADLSDAILDANLSGTIFIRANLSGAVLDGARNLTQMQLDEACGKPRTLPPRLTLDKPCSPPPVGSR